MSRILKPLGATVEDFKMYLQTGEGKIADIIKSATALASENKGLSVTLDSIDSTAAVQALEEVQAQMDKLWSAVPAQEAVDAKANGIIDKYLYSDRSKMVAWYAQQVELASTQDRIDKLVDDIADDIEHMEDFVDGEMTFASFVRSWCLGKPFGLPSVSQLCALRLRSCLSLPSITKLKRSVKRLNVSCLSCTMFSVRPRRNKKT